MRIGNRNTDHIDDRRRCESGASRFGCREYANQEVAHTLGTLGLRGCEGGLRIGSPCFHTGELRLPHRDTEARNQPAGKHHGEHHAAAMSANKFSRSIPVGRRMRRDRLSIEMAFDIVGERSGRCIAAIGFVGERLGHDIVEIAAQRLTQASA